VRVVAFVLDGTKVLGEPPGLGLVAVEREAPHLIGLYGHV
jgi:hypothetical protein